MKLCLRSVKTIACRDFLGYFSGPGFFIVSGLFGVFMSYTYFMGLSQFIQQSQMMSAMRGGDGLNFHREVIVGHISNINLVLLILIPFLSVRLFTEEKRQRTFDLLLTSPVTAAQIVCGKFLAGLMVVGTLILVSLIYPLATLLLAPVQMGTLASAYLGLIFIGGIYVAIGVFASSLTESTVVAGFVAIILSLALWFIAWTSAVVEDSTWTAILNHISVSHHFGQFIQGNIQVAGVVFCLSVMGLYAFLTERVVESTRWR